MSSYAEVNKTSHFWISLEGPSQLPIMCESVDTCLAAHSVPKGLQKRFPEAIARPQTSKQTATAEQVMDPF